MKIKFVYRIDDIHPAMMWGRFWEVMSIMREHQVVPLLGVIPENRDESLNFDQPNPDFFSIMRCLVNAKRAEICQHGYQHVYTTRQKSVNQMLYGRTGNSEFAGIPYKQQINMIKKGREILEAEGLFTDVWMAPSHTNDSNTFRALKALNFKYITDGIALYPYYRFGLMFVPQQIWHPRIEFPFSFGIFTICLHLNDLTDKSLKEIKLHLESGYEIMAFSEIVKLPYKWYYGAGNALYKLKRIAAHSLVKPYRNLKAQFSQ